MDFNTILAQLRFIKKIILREPKIKHLEIMASTSFSDGFLDDVQNEALMKPITKVELLEILESFKSKKAHMLDGWLMDFVMIPSQIISWNH